MSIELRGWAEADAPALAASLDNPNVRANLRDGLPTPYTEQDALDFIRYLQKSSEAGTEYAFAIVADGEVVGNLGITRGVNIHSRTAEMGYYIAEPHWGRGIGSEAVRLACAWVFENTNILRIYAEPFTRNAASCRILEKAGFALEGILRKNAVKNGVVEDMALYALVREQASAAE